MKIFAVSDIHIDYDANARWIKNLSAFDYRSDTLILGGDVTDNPQLLEWCFKLLTKRFRTVVFVPGNHDLWVVRQCGTVDSFQKLLDVRSVAADSGVAMQPVSACGLTIVPLYAWYDYSFGSPSEELRSTWMDYYACRWPAGFEAQQIAEYFESLNEGWSNAQYDELITFSHFVPRIDLMPKAMPRDQQRLYPVLGTTRLERQLRQLKSRIHVYGHSHLNRDATINGVRYCNNAFGYPSETTIASKSLLCIYDQGDWGRKASGFP